MAQASRATERLVPSQSFLAVMLVIAAGLLYGQFVHNPFVFDDEPFFRNPAFSALGDINLPPTLRWLAYTSFGLTYRFAGMEMPLFRLGNLLLHAAAAIAIMVWAATLIRAANQQSRDAAKWRLAAFGAALLFALHPVAVYGAGYLVQRSIVMATLFVILMLIAFLHGLMRGSRAWFGAGVVFYWLAMFSKEHAIAAPLLVFAQTVLLARSGALTTGRYAIAADAGFATVCGALVRTLIWPMFACALVAVYIVLLTRGVLGAVYEPLASELITQLAGESAREAQTLTYSLSIFNQAFLFFKYLFLWVMPNTQWMSVDMRETLVTHYLAFPQLAGAIAFVAYPFVAAALLWRGGRQGIAGFAMLAPWLLFVTELSTVRIQESFVLYRSYLWFAPPFVLIALLLGSVRARYALPLVLACSVIFFALAYERLTVFSTSLNLWRDAARLIDDKGPRILDFRIHYVFGNHLRQAGQFRAAVERYDLAIARRPGFGEAYQNRGSAYMAWERYDQALADFEKAVALNPKNGGAYMGLALASRALGRTEKFDAYLKQSCALGWKNACHWGNDKPVK